jgi:hypothetical protein
MSPNLACWKGGGFEGGGEEAAISGWMGSGAGSLPFTSAPSLPISAKQAAISYDT